MSKIFLMLGALAAGIAVMSGAFGVHAMAERVTPARLQTFETAVRYQMYHALALLIVGWALTLWPFWSFRAAGSLFVTGIFLFSGSLYLLVLTDTAWLGAVTPLGGVAFILGWLFFAWGVWQQV